MSSAAQILRSIAAQTQADEHRDALVLPKIDPLLRLPHTFDEWETIAADLPRLTASGELRAAVDAMPLIDVSPLRRADELRRAMVIVSHFAHAHLRLTRGESPRRLPAKLAVPWHAIARRLNVAPAMDYASRVLHNWRRIDAGRPIATANLRPMIAFSDDESESRATMVQVDLEASSGTLLAAIDAAQQAAATRDRAKCLSVLSSVVGAIESLNEIVRGADFFAAMKRLREMCRARDVVFEGVGELRNQPQQLDRAIGFESSTVFRTLASVFDSDSLDGGRPRDSLCAFAGAGDATMRETWNRAALAAASFNASLATSGLTIHAGTERGSAELVEVSGVPAPAPSSTRP